MKQDFGKMSEKELLSLRNSIDKALSRIEKKRKSEARKAIAAEARKHGFSLNELVGAPSGKTDQPKSKMKKAAPAKYRDPNDANKTWSGKGRRPAWYKTAIEAGIDPKSLEI